MSGTLGGGPQGSKETLPWVGSFFFGDGLGVLITSESNLLDNEGLATMFVDLGSFFRMSSREL